MSSRQQRQHPVPFGRHTHQLFSTSFTFTGSININPHSQSYQNASIDPGNVLIPNYHQHKCQLPPHFSVILLDILSIRSPNISARAPLLLSCRQFTTPSCGKHPASPNGISKNQQRNGHGRCHHPTLLSSE